MSGATTPDSLAGLATAVGNGSFGRITSGATSATLLRQAAPPPGAQRQAAGPAGGVRGPAGAPQGAAARQRTPAEIARLTDQILAAIAEHESNRRAAESGMRTSSERAASLASEIQTIASFAVDALKALSDAHRRMQSAAGRVTDLARRLRRATRAARPGLQAQLTHARAELRRAQQERQAARNQPIAAVRRITGQDLTLAQLDSAQDRIAALRQIWQALTNPNANLTAAYATANQALMRRARLGTADLERMISFGRLRREIGEVARNQLPTRVRELEALTADRLWARSTSADRGERRGNVATLAALRQDRAAHARLARETARRIEYQALAQRSQHARALRMTWENNLERNTRASGAAWLEDFAGWQRVVLSRPAPAPPAPPGQNQAGQAPPATPGQPAAPAAPPAGAQVAPAAAAGRQVDQVGATIEAAATAQRGLALGRERFEALVRDRLAAEPAATDEALCLHVAGRHNQGRGYGADVLAHFRQIRGDRTARCSHHGRPRREADGTLAGYRARAGAAPNAPAAPAAGPPAAPQQAPVAPAAPQPAAPAPAAPGAQPGPAPAAPQGAAPVPAPAGESAGGGGGEGGSVVTSADGAGSGVAEAPAPVAGPAPSADAEPTPPDGAAPHETSAADVAEIAAASEQALAQLEEAVGDETEAEAEDDQEPEAAA